jgi:hypothetical protein
MKHGSGVSSQSENSAIDIYNNILLFSFDSLLLSSRQQFSHYCTNSAFS